MHGLWQVTAAVFLSCNVSSDGLVKEWSPPHDDGSVHVWLQTGSVYYFIDPVGNNCLNGVKAKVHSISI